jgi:hypothetical protein
MTPDPSGSGSNLYAYAGGDPVNNVDRDGRRPIPEGCDQGIDSYTEDCGRNGGMNYQSWFIIEPIVDDEGTTKGYDTYREFSRTGPGSTLAFATRSKPKLKFAGNLENLFDQAFKLAQQYLDKPDCANLFNGMSTSNLKSILEGANYEYFTSLTGDDHGNLVKNPPEVWATTNPATSTVTINSDGNFLKPFDNITPYPGVTLNGNQMRAYVLLHELGHLIGLNNEIDDIDKPQNSAFNKLLLQDCVGKN